MRVLQAGTSFLFIGEPVADVTGDRSFKDGVLTISRKDGTVSEYPAQKLSASGLFAFYKPEVPGIISLIIWYFVFLAVSIVMEFGKTYWLQSSANKVIRKLRMDVYAHIQRLPVYFFDNLPAGKVVSRVTNDTEAVKDLFIAVLANFFSGIINMLGVYVALFILDVRLGLICLFIVPVIYLWVVLYRKFATKYNTIIRSRLSEINAIINESIQGMSIIRIFRREAKTKEEFEHLNDDYMKHQNKMLNLNAFTSHNLVNVIRNLAFAAVLWYFGSAQLGGDSVISLGVLYAFVDVLGRLFQPITGMVNQLAALDTSMVSAGRVFALMDEPGEDVTDGSMPRYKGNVEFKDVSFAYKQDYVLKNISFEAKQGQTVALVGHTGSGKSSIINLLFRFYDPQKRPDHDRWPAGEGPAQAVDPPAYGHRAAGPLPVHRDDSLQRHFGRRADLPGSGGAGFARRRCNADSRASAQRAGRTGRGKRQHPFRRRTPADLVCAGACLRSCYPDSR